MPSADERILLEQVKTHKKLAPDGSNAELLSALAARGLLSATMLGRGKARQPAFALTAEGRKAIKPAPAPRAKGAKRPPAATAADLAALEARLFARLDQLAVSLGAVAPPASAPLPAAGLRAAIATGIRDADLAGRHGGLVPIPEIRKLVLSRVQASRDDFDAALLGLERDFKVDLKIANDARRPDAGEGIEVPGRGLVYFALSK